MAAEGAKHPYLLTVEETAKEFGTDVDRGLSASQIPSLQEKYGPNELDVGGAIPWYRIFFRQLFNAMILVGPAAPAECEHPPLTRWS
jgi:P-type Na+/K+ transporter